MADPVKMKYAMHENGKWLGLTCGQCGRTSWNENDRKNVYCGHCNVYGELEPEAIRELVLVINSRQAAALVLAATAGMMSPLLLKLDAKGIPMPETTRIFADIAEAVGIINDAMGNPRSEDYEEIVRMVRKLADEGK